MIQKLRYYISDTLDPYKNLATEKYLLDSTPDDCCTLYLWQNQNTIVIGKNQNPWSECSCTLIDEDGCKIARRLSGGGAVFHDIGNLNFTFLCSTENYNIPRQMEVIKEACKLAGISAEISGRNDILADDRKFSGNAFYNSKGKSYHHGTLLINADTERMQRYLTPPKAKLESKGVKSVKSRVVNLKELSPSLTCQDMIDYMLSAFKQVYGLPVEAVPVIDTAKILSLTEEYSSWEYIYGKTIPFKISFEEQFSWGHMQLLLDINEGIISSVQLYTDAIDWNISDTISSALSGCRFEVQQIQDAILRTTPQPIANDFISLFNKE